MLFGLSVDYSAASIAAMRQNPTTSRREAVEQLLESAGGKVINMFGRIANGPGALVIFDVPDPASAAAIMAVVTSTGAVTNARLERLLTQEEIVNIRQQANKLHSAYRTPGQ